MTTSAVLERRALVALLLGTSALAWMALWRWGASPYGHTAHLHPHANTGTAAGFLLFVGGWTVMTVAMMLPTITPLMVVFSRAVQGNVDRVLLLTLLCVGYLGIWVLAGAVAYAGVSGLRAVASMIALDRAGWIVGAGALVVAGLYQFSALKDRCLEHCRSPFSFLMEKWGDDLKRRALSLGARHGLFCLGCCWSLMLLMLPLGASNIAWMLLLGAVMAAEKNAPRGREMSKPLGVVLLLLAAVVVVRGQVF